MVDQNSFDDLSNIYLRLFHTQINDVEIIDTSDEVVYRQLTEIEWHKSIILDLNHQPLPFIILSFPTNLIQKVGNTIKEVVQAILNWQDFMLRVNPNFFGRYESGSADFFNLEMTIDQSGKVIFDVIYD
jgi:hypothetical protein